MGIMKIEYGKDYYEYLSSPKNSKWRKWLNPQIPYAWNLTSLKLGFVLDIGCGVGRNLINLKGQGVGVEINPLCVEEARKRKLQAFIPEDFFASGFFIPDRFDSILVSHVVEHMNFQDAQNLISPYLPCLKSKGRLVLITPQERGFKKDQTHVEYFGFEKLKDLEKSLGLYSLAQYSFPFPRYFGSFFPYNEFVSISVRPYQTQSFY